MAALPLQPMLALQEAEEKLRRSEETLAEMRGALTRSARITSLGMLTASIAHEVNQPLAGIVTNASTCLRLLAGDSPDIEGARETVRRAIRDGNRAAQVITRLRALFANGPTTVESLSLNDATREVIPLMLGELRRLNVRLTLDLVEDLPLVVADRVQLQQVIINLIRNATDSVSGLEKCRRNITLKTWVDARDGLVCVCLTVRDRGIGVDAEAMSRLFDAFHSTKPNGMGIGLAVSRWIIEGHGGRIWAGPNVGPGAAFSFSIPHVPGGSTYDQCRHAADPAAYVGFESSSNRLRGR